jgi:uncharacterized protein YdeI (BOF family)
MKQKIYLGLAIATGFSLLTTSNLVLAQTRIRNLQQSQGVTITGRVVGFGEADENEWILDDGSGRLIVDAGPRWWRQINVSLGDNLTVVGEMDNGEFDAFSVTKSNGTVINIRSSEGPPPWAGNRRSRNSE